MRVTGTGQGRFVLFKVRHPGLDPEEHVHALAFERRGDALVAIDTVALRDRIEADAEVDAVDDPTDMVRDAIAHRVFVEQHRLAQVRRPGFERRLRRIERFLEDRMKVLRRDRAQVARRVLQAEGERDRAIGADARSRAEAKLRRASERLEHLEQRLTQLAAREDETHQRHRGHLLDRCFAPPSVEVLVDVPWSGHGHTDP